MHSGNSVLHCKAVLAKHEYLMKSSALALSMLAPLAFAGSDKSAKSVAPVQEPSPWEITAAQGLSFSRGSSDNLLISTQLLASYFKGSDELYLGANYIWGETEGTTSANNLLAYATYNRLITDHFYIGAGSQYFRNPIADLDYRLSVTPHLGYRFIAEPGTLLGVEFGAGAAWEQQAGVKDEFPVFHFAQVFEHRLSSASRIYERVTYQPEVGDFNNALLIAEAGIATLLSKHWEISFGARNVTDFTPAAGREKNDFTLMAALRFSQGGYPDPVPVTARRTLKPGKVAIPPPAMGWNNALYTGIALAAGNSEALAYSLAFDSSYRSKSDEFFTSLIGNYGQANGNTSLQEIRNVTQYNLLAGPDSAFYYGLNSNFRHDDLNGLDYRWSPGAQVGAYLINTDATKLSLDVGPSWTWEESAFSSDSYFSLTLGQRFSVQLTKTLSIGESLVYTGEANDLGNGQLIISAFIEADLTDNISLRFTGSDINRVGGPEGLNQNEILVSGGIAVKF
jgi:hypothetical protein